MTLYESMSRRNFTCHRMTSQDFWSQNKVLPCGSTNRRKWATVEFSSFSPSKWFVLLTTTCYSWTRTFCGWDHLLAPGGMLPCLGRGEGAFREGSFEALTTRKGILKLLSLPKALPGMVAFLSPALSWCEAFGRFHSSKKKLGTWIWNAARFPEAHIGEKYWATSEASVKRLLTSSPDFTRMSWSLNFYSAILTCPWARSSSSWPWSTGLTSVFEW